jgi:uncharacterized surface protein with fasciclin (FAS1) repeats
MCIQTRSGGEVPFIHRPTLKEFTMSTPTTRKAAALLMALTLGASACASDDPEETVETTVAEAAEEVAEEEAVEVGTIVDVAVANGSFTTLVAAVQAAGLVDTLSGEGPFTVFAPTDDAFAAALGDLGLAAEDLLADTELLTTILTYHVVSGEVLSTDLSDGMMAATVQGEEVAIDLSDGVKVNGANVVIADVDASNGVIHAIDYVLLPPSLGLGGDAMEEEEAMEEEGPGNLIEVATEAGNFTTLLAAADATGLTETLATGTVATIFAPTDEAFATALEALGLTAEELLADTETLTAILTYHAVGGIVTSADLADGPVVMLNGLEATIDLSDGVKINDANVVAADIEASNGVIHVIDAVLLPPAS